MDVVLFSSLWEPELHRGVRVNAVGEGNPGIVPGGLLGKTRNGWGGGIKKKKDSVFTATFMAQFRFVSAGFVSCPLPGV